MGNETRDKEAMSSDEKQPTDCPTLGGAVRRLLNAAQTAPVSVSTGSELRNRISAITGQRKEDSVLASLIGTPHFASGVREFVQKAPRQFPGQCGEEAAARALYSWLRQEKKLPSDIDKWGTTMIRCLTSSDDPCSDEAGRKMLRITAMLAHYPSQEQDEAVAEVILGDYAVAVRHIPAYAVERGAQAVIASSGRFRPGIAEFRKSCEIFCPEFTRLREYLARIRRHWSDKDREKEMMENNQNLPRPIGDAAQKGGKV